MKSKTITVVTPFYYPQVNGVSHVAQKNVEALLDLGYDVIVLTHAEGVSKGNEKVYAFDVKGNGTLLHPVRGEKRKFVEKSILSSRDSDLMILHCWHSWSTNLILDNYHNLKSKVFVYSHGTSNRSSNFNLYFILRYTNYFFESIKLMKYFKIIDGLICITDNSTHYRCLDIKNIDISNKNLLPNPIIGRNVNVKDSVNAKERYLNFFNTDLKIAFCISNYEEIKNQRYLLELVKKYSFKLICVGSKKTPYYDTLEKIVSHNGLEDRVILDYNVDDSSTEWLFKNSSFFLFASKNDFSPLVLIESSKYGLPFLSFKTADNDRLGGFFCKDNHEYEEHLQQYISGKNELNKIGSEGLMYYEKNNSFESYKNKLSKIITNENLVD